MPDTAGYPLPTMFQTALNVLAFYFPLMLYAVWATLGVTDLARRDDGSRMLRVGWVVAILLLPWIGAAAYHVAGRSTVSPTVRAAVLVGGVGGWGLLLLLGALAGGIT